MKFYECIGPMVAGQEAVRQGTRRKAVRRNGRTLFVEAPLGRGWVDRDLSDFRIDEEGWDLVAETRDVCGITFTRQQSEFYEHDWVSENRCLRLLRQDPRSDWTCYTTEGVFASHQRSEDAVAKVLNTVRSTLDQVSRVLGLGPIGWQPIETAPRDESLVLACEAGDGCSPVVAHYCSERQKWLEPLRDTFIEPTHWAYIPPVPEAKKGR